MCLKYATGNVVVIIFEFVCTLCVTGRGEAGRDGAGQGSDSKIVHFLTATGTAAASAGGCV